MSGSSVDNVKISPVNVLWQMEQVERIDFAGLTKTSMDGKSFNLSSALDAALYYAWADNGGSDPAVAGRTAIPVSVTACGTPAQLATAFAAAISAINSAADFVATAAGSIMTVARVDIGECTVAEDTDAGVLIALSRRGRDYDLGLLEGDVGLDFKPSNFILTAHQYGKTPLAALNQGFDKLECATTLLETEASQLEALYKIYGGVYTPSGGTKVYGVGSAAQGKNMMVEAGRLVLKPVNAADDTENVTMMLAIPVPESLVFSGEKPRTLKLAWQGFVDRDFNSKFNAIAVGDISQNLVES